MKRIGWSSHLLRRELGMIFFQRSTIRGCRSSSVWWPLHARDEWFIYINSYLPSSSKWLSLTTLINGVHHLPYVRAREIRGCCFLSLRDALVSGHHKIRWQFYHKHVVMLYTNLLMILSTLNLNDMLSSSLPFRDVRPQATHNWSLTLSCTCVWLNMFAGDRHWSLRYSQERYFSQRVAMLNHPWQRKFFLAQEFFLHCSDAAWRHLRTLFHFQLRKGLQLRLSTLRTLFHFLLRKVSS